MLFPLITFPYAARIMQADGIGQINFYSSIIGYVSLFTSLGIPMYAVREIARVRDDVKARNNLAAEILLLHLLLSFVGYLIVGIISFFVPQVQLNIPLFFLLSLSILFTTIGCDWFYQGIEDFKYITIRGLVIKILSVAILFVTVKTKNDLMWYGFYCVFGVLGGNIFNFLRLGKYKDESPIVFSNLHPLRHFKSVLHVFALVFVISIYINLNTVMLGFMQNNESVGLFTTATKITSLCLGIMAALQSVMIPQMSNLVALGRTSEFSALAQKSLSFSMFISLPMSVGVFLTAPYLIKLLAGPSYLPTIMSLRIISGIIFMIGISGVLGMQILFPKGKENIVIKSTALGAIVNVILNIFLIPRYSQYGAAISTMVAEFVVTGSMMFLGKTELPIKWNIVSNWIYLLASCVMGILIYLFEKIGMCDFCSLLGSVIIGMISYVIVLFLCKESMLNFILNFIKSKIK